MKRALFITGVVVAALGVTGVAASAKGWGMGGPRGMMPMMNFEDLDVNGDGKVTQDEMAAMGKARFDKADANGDGFLDAEEMEAHMIEMAKEYAPKVSKRMIDKKDADSDGKLSFEEMKPNGKRTDKMFGRFDTDGDGAISQAEFEEAQAKMRDHRKNKKQQN
ncbi:EF hand [Shimia gijangensis]|uniref:EF hand n=1 Tax=Shimia gijangensis TaxID=1470563 RepID=A0A1M6LKH0_9RHOB|nr:EF-hand domain-containing protein [Shimia gijangensis]SHJ71711.1 EF hand [Shimia gijangensis]